MKKKIVSMYIIITLAFALGHCGKKKKPFLWLLNNNETVQSQELSEAVLIPPTDENLNDNNDNSYTSTDSNNISSTGISVYYPSNQFTEQDPPTGAFEGIVLQGNDENTFVSGSVIPSCNNVSCLLDRILGSISNWNQIDNNGYSLIERRQANTALLPTEIADIQLRLTGSYTANEVRNFMIQLVGTVDGSGNVSNFPDNPSGAQNSNTFRILIQASQDEDGNAIVLIGVTTIENFEYIETILTGLIDGSNVGPSNQNPNEYNDTLLADAPPKADFLFVVDNSGSMTEEQNAVIANSLRFFDRLDTLGLDFKVGVITTDNSTIRHTGFSNIRSEFETAINAGINGSGVESCTYFAEKAISTSSTNNRNAILTNGSGSLNSVGNAGYPRVNSKLAVICITDESDAYTKWDGSGSNTDTPRFDLNDNIFTQREIPFYAIMPLDSNGQYGSCTGINGNANVTYNFSNFPNGALNMQILASTTGGSVSSICSENYGAFLESLANSIAARASSYRLSKNPISSSIRVYVNNVEIPNTMNPPEGETGFNYISNENKIVFTGKLPTEGSQIRIVYQSYE